MKQSVTLKGSQDGYVISLDDQASFDRILEELKVLLAPLKREAVEPGNEETKPNDLYVTVKTGNRYLNEEQRELISNEIQQNPVFIMKKIESLVVPVEHAEQWHELNQTKIEVQNVRSGQILTVPGSVLIFGDIHPGGIVKAGGNIIILGSLKGLAQAGCNGNDQAVVVADFQYNAQIRIGENVHIIEKETEEPVYEELKAAYMNDLHILEFCSLGELKKLRPAMGNVIGRLE